MQLRSLLVSLSSIAAVTSLIACANGIPTETEEGYLANTPAEAGAEEEGESIKAKGPEEDPEEQPSDPDAGTVVPDAGGDKDSGTTNPPPPPPPPPGGGTCAAPAACASATVLADVSGDTGADVRTISGSTSQWIKVRVNEDSSAALSLLVKATLTSPAGSNFDLYAYAGNGTTQQCSTVHAQSTSASSDAVTLEWGDGSIIGNGVSDDRVITFEVRANASTTCSSANKWTLKVEGNKL